MSGSVGLLVHTGRPVLLKADGELAGFALVDCNRQQGIGSSAAGLIFDRFRGSWMIGQMPNNQPAIAFWRKLIAGYAGNRFSETVRYVDHADEEMNVFEFRNLAKA